MAHSPIPAAPINMTLASFRRRRSAVMSKNTITETYDVAEHLRTPEEMALYLDACIVESEGDAAFIAKALGDVARAQAINKQGSA